MSDDIAIPDSPDPDFPDLDRRAVLASVDVVSRVKPGDLGRATPCSAWDLGALLAHMTAQHRGFAAAAAGAGADLTRWRVQPLDDDPVTSYRVAAEEVLAAFTADGVLERDFALPEITRAMSFPARQAISFHLVDYVVHGWDVARSLGINLRLDADVVQGALSVAQRVPGGESRLVPGAAFAPGLPAAANASAFDQVLLLLGRSPSWQPTPGLPPVARTA